MIFPTIDSLNHIRGFQQIKHKLARTRTLNQHASCFISETPPKAIFLAAKVHQKGGVIFCPRHFTPLFLSVKKSKSPVANVRLGQNRFVHQQDARHDNR